jgi:hypothetical protein
MRQDELKSDAENPPKHAGARSSIDPVTAFRNAEAIR